MSQFTEYRVIQMCDFTARRNTMRIVRFDSVKWGDLGRGNHVKVGEPFRSPRCCAI